MPRKTKTIPKPGAIQTTVGPRMKNARPILAAGILLLGLLHTIAVVDYRHDQPGFFDAIARQTDDFGRTNLIGNLGSDLAFLSLLGCGLLAWMVLPVTVQFAWLLSRNRLRHIALTRVLSTILMITAGSAFADYGENLFWQELPAQFPSNYLPEGMGGIYGDLLFNSLLQDTFGPLGTGLILGFLTLLGLYFTFRNPIHFTIRLLGRIPLPQRPVRPPKPQKAKLRLDLPVNQELPAIDRAKRNWLRPLFGKSVVEATREDYTPDFYFEAQNRPNPRFFEDLGKTVPRPQPIPEGTRIHEEPRSQTISFVPISEGEIEAIENEFSPEKSAVVPAQTIKLNKEPTPLPTPTPRPEKGIKIIASEKLEREERLEPKRRAGYQFPPLNLLESSPEEPLDNATNHQDIADRLKSTLEDFKIKVELGEVHIGPVITRYDLHPAPGIRVEKITSLERNLAMSLQAQSVRILAPVPGKGCVGIEVPNEIPQSVRVRDILESKVWSNAKAEIPVVLGKDVSGKPLVTDLTRMPHLLIAGSTGSGKTVCINAIICSLLYHASPDDIRFIMVDPKIVEMKIFNDLPHMLIPVVTDPKRVPNALKWLISEMDRRYQIFAKVGVRNVAGFNAKILKNREAKELEKSMDASLTAEERAAVSRIEVQRDQDALEIPDRKLPYIVCIIDELADLMMVAPADVETCIARLAQLARAAGIHLVIATQRPSVNVITGIIKANLPSRIAFKVASKIDSRTILDGNGADALIGRGDMLFIPPGAHHLVRAQGAFVSDEEIAAIVDFLKVNGPPDFAEEVQRQVERDPDADDDEDDGGATDEDWGDAMVPDAIEVIRSTRRASTSMLQRRLRIGYNRAARIMEILEQRGLVGPDNGSQPREITGDLENP